MKHRAASALVLSALFFSACGGAEPPLSPATQAAASAHSPGGGAAVAAGPKPKPQPGDNVYILVVQCQPKGDKRAHFDVSPVSGSTPGVQLRCKGTADMHGAGPWVVRPKSDTDQSYSCSPSPITVKVDKAKNKVVCTLR